MNKIFVFVFLACSLANQTYSQSNEYHIKLNSSGLIENINTSRLLGNRKDASVRLTVSFDIRDSLVLAHYKSYMELRMNLVEELGKQKIKDELNLYFGITSLEVDKLADESKYYINTIPKEVKEAFGYPDFKYQYRGLGIKTDFSPYTIETTAYSGHEEDGLFTNASLLPDLGVRNVFSYSVIVGNAAKTNFEKIHYTIRFNKPVQTQINNTLSQFVKAPAMGAYDTAAQALTNALKIVKAFDQFVTRIESTGGGLYSHAPRVHAVRDSLEKEEAIVHSYFLSNKGFVKSWLWYTGGVPKLNPFDAPKPAENPVDFATLIRKHQGDSIRLKNSLAELEKKYTLYTETIIKSNLKDKLTTADGTGVVLTKIDEIAKAINDEKITYLRESNVLDSLRKKRNTLAGDQRKQNALLKEFGIRDVFLYDGYTFVGRKRCLLTYPKEMVHYRSYNRADKFKPFLNLPLAYDQTSKVFVLVENEKIRNTFSASLKEINDQSQFTATVEPVVDNFASTFMSSTEFQRVVAKQTKSFSEAGSNSLRFDLAAIMALTTRIQYYEKNLVKPPKLPSSYQRDTSPAGFTDYYRADFPDSTKSSYRYNVNVVQGTKTNGVKFRVNKIYRVLPSIGLVFTNSDDPEIILNTDGTIKEVNHFNKTSLMMGVKIYPFGGAPIYDPKFFISLKRNPVVDFRKIHVMAGVNAMQPLKQFYLGAGIDLWSGLSLNGGLHAINKKQQKISSGKIEEDNYLDYHNAYFSVNVDVSLAIKLIGLLVKK